MLKEIALNNSIILINMLKAQKNLLLLIVLSIPLVIVLNWFVKSIEELYYSKDVTWSIMKKVLLRFCVLLPLAHLYIHIIFMIAYL